MKKSIYNVAILPADAVTLNESGELAVASPQFCTRNCVSLSPFSNRMPDALEQWDDAKLLAEIHLLNEAAYAEFCRRYSPQVWMSAGKIARRNRDPEMADEIFQEIWLHVLRQLPEWEPTTKFRNFLSVVAANKAIDIERQYRSRRAGVDSIDDSERPIPVPATVIDIETRITIQECIERLNPAERKLWEDKIANRDPEEAAAELHTTVNNWRVLVWRMRKKLQDCINGKKCRSAKSAGENLK